MSISVSPFINGVGDIDGTDPKPSIPLVQSNGNIAQDGLRLSVIAEEDWDRLIADFDGTCQEMTRVLRAIDGPMSP